MEGAEVIDGLLRAERARTTSSPGHPKGDDWREMEFRGEQGRSQKEFGNEREMDSTSDGHRPPLQGKLI